MKPLPAQPETRAEQQARQRRSHRVTRKRRKCDCVWCSTGPRRWIRLWREKL